jgi:hypothetical protein
VRYAGLPSHPSHDGPRVLRHGFGAVLALDLADQAAAHRFLDALRLVSQLANIGDAKSVAIHPWTTTHATLAEAGDAPPGVFPGTVRLSFGLEALEDLRSTSRRALRRDGHDVGRRRRARRLVHETWGDHAALLARSVRTRRRQRRAGPPAGPRRRHAPATRCGWSSAAAWTTSRWPTRPTASSTPAATTRCWCATR